jgi:predicted phosphoribosyltransferase
MIFRDRRDAGRRLAQELMRYRGRDDVLVLALPRGGVPVGYEVARALDAPLDVFLVRKLGVPGYEELAMGAIASGDVRVLNDDVVAALGIGEHAIETVQAREQRELERRERAFRGDRAAPDVRGRTVVVVDDGLATGCTMRAAVAALRTRAPRRIVVAVPVAAPNTCAELRRDADDVVCAVIPRDFHGVGQWYDDFEQTTDAEVTTLLGQAAQAHGAAHGA